MHQVNEAVIKLRSGILTSKDFHWYYKTALDDLSRIPGMEHIKELGDWITKNENAEFWEIYQKIADCFLEIFPGAPEVEEITNQLRQESISEIAYDLVARLLEITIACTEESEEQNQ